tara:strand:- start:248 stop:604 length:357 start_codon:yes stop_codon:yes gene_type:complete
MTNLVACLSNDESTWPHIKRLIQDEDWDNIILITQESVINKFTHTKEITPILVDFTKPAKEVITILSNGLKNKISGLEIALNLVSGSGKEHMIILSTILKLGVGFRLVAITKEGVEEI